MHSSMKGSEARRREEPERRGGGVWGGAPTRRNPSQYGGLGAKIFKKSTLKSRIFLHFCKLKSIGARAILKVEGHFFTVPIHFYLVPTIMGGHVPPSLQYE